MERTVKINDTLQEDVDGIKEEVENHFKNWIEENQDCTDFDTYYQDGGCDAVHEIADSSTPIYYSDIDGLYYLYSSELDEAYDNTGIGDRSEDNYKQVAIYCYLSEAGFEHQSKVQVVFDDYIGEIEDNEEKFCFEDLKHNIDLI